jgi:hypothetical protein
MQVVVPHSLQHFWLVPQSLGFVRTTYRLQLGLDQIGQRSEGNILLLTWFRQSILGSKTPLQIQTGLVCVRHI